MPFVRHVAISGELGSGKSAVAAALSERIDAAVVSTGAIHRRIAAERGESALETNLVAEHDASIDELIDGELVRLSASSERIIFDSRMAWHFVEDVITIHLLVDPWVAAARMTGRVATTVEGYDDVQEARAHADDRHASERRRFLATYDVDIDRLRNYAVVIDTSHEGIDELADLVAGIVAAPEALPDEPHLLVSARRLVDGLSPDQASAEWEANRVRIAYDRPDFVVLGGAEVVVAAAERGDDLVPAVLVAEGDEEISPGITAADLVRDR